MNRNGFSLTEMMMAVGIFGLVIAGTLSATLICSKSWYESDIQMRCMQKGNMAVQRLVYGAYGSNGIRSAISSNILISATGANWKINYHTIDGANYEYQYTPDEDRMLYCDFSTGSNFVQIASNITSCAMSSTADGVSFDVTASLQDGRFYSTQTISTFVKFRN